MRCPPCMLIYILSENTSANIRVIIPVICLGRTEVCHTRLLHLLQRSDHELSANKKHSVLSYTFVRQEDSANKSAMAVTLWHVYLGNHSKGFAFLKEQRHYICTTYWMTFCG